jgi:hypothetical protein
MGYANLKALITAPSFTIRHARSEVQEGNITMPDAASSCVISTKRYRKGTAPRKGARKGAGFISLAVPSTAKGTGYIFAAEAKIEMVPKKVP